MIQDLLNAVAARLGVERAVEVMLDEIQRETFRAGVGVGQRYHNEPPTDEQIAEAFENWAVTSATDKVPPEARD